jgi:hypothetical protein
MALPGPLRVAFRPVEKMSSGLVLPLAKQIGVALSPLYTILGAGAGVTGGSFASLPMTVYNSAGASPLSTVGGASGAGSPPPLGSHVDLHAGASATGIHVADPVAERRREKALQSLDKRLAELRSKMRGTGAVPV